MSTSYNTTYQQQPAPGYYASHEAKPPQADPTLSYDMPHQQAHNPQANWSNGYYQQNQPPYTQNAMNSPYQMTYNNGVNPAPNHQSQISNVVQGPPQQNNPPPPPPPHYQMSQQPEQQPYDSRTTNMSTSYNATYQQQPQQQQQPAPGYYASHEAQLTQPDQTLSYDMPHQQIPHPQAHPPPPHNPQANMSNGYYQQNQPSYGPNTMNSPYQMGYNNGVNPAPNQSRISNVVQAPAPQNNPPPPPHYQMNQQAEQPYDGRTAPMSTGYNATYQQQQPPAPSYYASPEAQPPQADPTLSYDMPPHQQQPHQPQAQWSNGCYQQTQPPYTPNAMNSPYQMTYNNGVNPAPNHQSQISNVVQGPPQQNNPPPPPPPHYQQQQHQQHQQQQHQQQQQINQQPPQQPQHWPMQNQTKPIERTKAGEKKPVKPRAPKKQSDPNAPSGRRKRPIMTEENKRSGYANYYKTKRASFPVNWNFTQLSKAISESWNNLREDERAIYAEDVSKKRKEMLKKKASQQAQNLLVQG